MTKNKQRKIEKQVEEKIIKEEDTEKFEYDELEKEYQIIK